MNKKALGALLVIICLFAIACRLSGELESSPVAPPTAAPERSPPMVVRIATWTPAPAPPLAQEPEMTAAGTAALFTPEPGTVATPQPSTSPTATPSDWQAGPLINYQGVQFRLDPVLSEGVFVRAPDFTSGVEFSHSRVTNFCHQQPFCIRIYDAPAFSQDPFAGWAIEWVAQLIDGEQEGLPTRGAAFLIETQTRRIPFQNGAGLRAVTMVGQMEYLAYQDAAYYEFHGLTDDGRFYVIIDIQIDHPLLMDNPDPEQNQRPTARLPHEPISPTDLTAIARYNRLLEMELEGQPPGNFIPSLTLLDALVASLLVEPAEME
jgi:hypothetical protein